MRFHRLSFISLLLLFAGARVALGDVASTSNRADLVAESIGIDDAGSFVAVVANRGLAVTATFAVEVQSGCPLSPTRTTTSPKNC